ncbi:MAG: hypothetical protein ABIJ45_00210 [Candidatus Zixiibacteriota bacterium]
MYKNIAAVILVALMAGLATCVDNATGPNIIVVSDSTVTLSLGQKAIILPDSLTIEFYQFGTESRCPMNAYCFWEGMADIIVRMHTPGSDTIIGHVGITGASNGSQLALVALGYHIEMTQLTPYPQDFGNLPNPNEYQATMHIVDATHNASDYEKIILSDLEPDNIFIDPFNLNSVSIDNDTIDINLTYSGGCETHLVWLFMSPPIFAESSPVQANLYIRHFGNDDNCDALITANYMFDLAPVADLYQTMYDDTNSIQLNIYDYFEGTPDSVISILYDW